MYVQPLITEYSFNFTGSKLPTKKNYIAFILICNKSKLEYLCSVFLICRVYIIPVGGIGTRCEANDRTNIFQNFH